MDIDKTIERSEFLDFARQLVESGEFDISSRSIANEVAEHGFASLDLEQQKEIEGKIFQQFAGAICSRCNENVRWSELSESLKNGGLCGHCDYKAMKE